MTAALPDNDELRLTVLRKYRILGTSREDIYEDITRLAARVCGTPIAAVTLIGVERQWFKSVVGLAMETAPDVAFCAHTILQPSLLIVTDARQDARFADSFLVTGPPNLRFYAGAPLVASDGRALGSLCVFDTVPRGLTGEQELTLCLLADQVTGHLELAGRVAAQERLGLVLEATECGVWEWLPPTGEVFLSAQWKRMLGYDEHEMPDRYEEWADRIHPDDAPRIQAEYQSCLDAGTPLHGAEYRLRHRDGTWRWVLSRARALRDSEGRITRLMGTTTDVTAQHQARERTEQILTVTTALGGALTTAEVADVILQAALPIFGTDMGLVVLLAEDGATLRLERAVGVPDHLAAPWREFSIALSVPLADAVRERRMVIVLSDEAHDGAYPALADVRLQARPGAVVAVPLLVGGRCVGGLGLICPPERCRDEEQQTFLWTLAGQCALALERARLYDAAQREVAERLRAEEALRESEQFARATLNGLSAEIAILDGDGTILAVNQAWRQFAAENIPAHQNPLINQSDSEGANYLRVCDGAAGAEAAEARQAALGIRSVAAGERTLFTLEYPCHSPRERRWFSLRATPYPGDGPARVVVSHENITDRKQAEEELRDSEAKFRSIIDSSPVACALNDAHQNITFLNTEFIRVFGYTLDEIPTLTDWWPRAYPDPHYRQWVATTWQDRLERAKQEGTPFEALELTVQCKDGAVRTVLAGAAPLGAAFAGTHLVSLYDITDRKRAEDERARLVEYNRLLLESTAEGIYGMDMQGHCTFINKAATRLLGYTVEEVLGRDMYALIHHSRRDGSPYPVEECPIHMTLQKGLPCHDETEVLWRQDGTPFHASYSSYPMTDAGRFIGAVITFSDITERKHVEQEKEKSLLEAQDRADRDPLTGLLNHRAFHKRLEEEAARAQREGSALAVVMLDLDNFKFFNDVYGHATGDEVLRHVADRLRGACRLYDVIARFGGDEFALLLPNVGHTPAAEIEARLRADLAGITYCPAGQAAGIPITVSLGASLFPHGGLDRQEVVQLADERLRRAKNGGDAEAEADQVRSRMGHSLEGFSMLDALVTAVDNKDRYTRRHSEDVMTYSLMIARQLEMDEEAQHTVAVAALLHDVGKIGIPDAILRKPGRLTNVEFEAVQQHPQMGAIMVGAVPGLEGTLDAIRHHHERWDGGGYPFGLRGRETPLIARLMAVADAFSAMTTDRPYRQGMDRGQALAILEAGAGTQWDAACVWAFRQVCGRDGAATGRTRNAQEQNPGHKGYTR